MELLFLRMLNFTMSLFRGQYISKKSIGKSGGFFSLHPNNHVRIPRESLHYAHTVICITQNLTVKLRYPPLFETILLKEKNERSRRRTINTAMAAKIIRYIFDGSIFYDIFLVFTVKKP